MTDPINKQPKAKRVVHFFDRRIIKKVMKLPSWIRPLMQFMTLLGQPPITVGLSAGMIGYGLASGDRLFIYSGAIAILTFIICSALKVFLKRERPDNDYVRSMIIQTFSFPSGHAAGSLASFGAGWYAASIIWPVLTIPLGIVVAIVCFLIGLSRVYLGAHYPSDVIGGWLLATAGIAVIVIVEALL